MRAFEHFPNLVTMFFTRAAEQGDAPFLWAKRDGAWTSISWHEASRRVASLATGLKAIGLVPGDRVMLVSENRPEWCISDLAIMAAGCITVPTYTTNTERDHAHVIENSGARAVIVSSQKLAQKLMPAVIRSIQPEFIIGIDTMRLGQPGAAVHDWNRLIATNDTNPAQVAQIATFQRSDPACIIYTSGTGGSPRGVVQHHGAILHNVAGCVAIIAEDFGWRDEVFLSFLPLSHAYEHTGGQHLPIGLGGQIYYAEGLDKLSANINEVRPTIMVVVPRLFEMLRTRITREIEKKGRTSQRLFSLAQDIGAREHRGEARIVDRAAKFVVDRLLKPKIAARFGGRLKAMVSGGAPLNAEIGRFFDAIGLTILQGYGQTEAAPVVCCNRPSAGIDMATVGPPLSDTEVKIAEDGEILVRGELVTQGYWRNEAETARILRDGWLHTGDIGAIDEKGRISITDRKKDLIINDKGENIAPQKVEGMLTLQPEIAQAMIAGEQRPYMVALLVPDPEWTQKWCAANGNPCNFETLSQNSAYRTAIGAAVERVNKELSVTERVRRFFLADQPFTIDNEQMTPSLKIRRHVLRCVYGERLDALYKA